ncbi:hypothetical protein [Corynebacterium ureicelerivorans]|uniref:hypothetical protein n=1 Tax=Corynebacterium ureicelerivorans TaxID=401472 RepID=UPI002357B221|nr:hypothetical protein [Corynebacterium ureicelerivorans]
MKTRLLPLVFVPLVALAGCSDAGGAVEYDNAGDLAGDLAGFDCTQRDIPLVGESAADCKSGQDRVFVAVFASDDERDAQIQELRDTPAWHAQSPEVAVGPRWVVQCEQPNVCGRVVDEIGGELLSAPDYS